MNPETLLESRFVAVEAPTLQELTLELGKTAHPFARVVSLGQQANGQWYAVIDNALTVVLTNDDVYALQQEAQDSKTDEVLTKYKGNLAA